MCGDVLNINEVRYEDWVTRIDGSFNICAASTILQPAFSTLIIFSNLQESFHSGESRQLTRGILSRRWIMILYMAETCSLPLRSSHVRDFIAAQNAITLIIDTCIISQWICDTSSHTRSHFIIILQYKYYYSIKNVKLFCAWRIECGISVTASGTYNFLIPYGLTRASTQHEKITVALSCTSYHKDDSYSEVDGVKSQGGWSSFFFEGRGNKIVLRCISLRAD